MWPFRRKTKQRRLEVRKSAPPLLEPRWQRFRKAGGIGALLAGTALLSLAATMDIWPADPLPYVLGQYVPADIYPRIQVSIRSPELRKQAIDTARHTTPATFRLDEEFVRRITENLTDLPQQLAGKTLDDLPQTLRDQWAISTDRDLQAWQPYTEAPGQENYGKMVAALLARLPALRIISRADLDEDRKGKRNPQTGWFVSPEDRRLESLRHITPNGEVRPAGRARKTSRNNPRRGSVVTSDRTDLISQLIPPVAQPVAKPIHDSVRTFLLDTLSKGLPLYRLDRETTQRDIREAVSKAEQQRYTRTYSPQTVLVPQTQTDTDSDQPVGLQDEQLKLLRAEHQAFSLHERVNHVWRWRGRLAGRVLLLAAVLAVLCAYVVRYKPQLLRDRRQLVALVAAMVAMLGVAKLASLGLGWNRHVVILPILLTGMVVAIAHDQRFALAIAAAIALLAVMQMREGLGLLLVMLAPVGAGVFCLREVRRRSKLIEVSAISAVAVGAAVWARALAGGVPWQFALTDSLWAGGFALLAGFLAQGILPLVERIFRVATSMTMLELSDVSRPLLKRLSLEAPGTFNHSLQLGQMCESAAEAIGANGLRARVGAYYHDVGKINKPLYFIENQDTRTSKHENLSPAMSLLIIRGHVKDGLDLAHEYALPPTFREFVATHHGTTLVQYFYHAATEKTKAEQQPAPEEFEYRYPGPKPRTKEAAILMLADASESSVRAMPEPAPSRIEQRVHDVVLKRLTDGQLDDCELTHREVHLIEASLVKTLCGMYHARIAYPTTTPAKPAGAAQETPEPAPTPAAPK